MLQVSRMTTALIAVFASFPLGQAEAGCQLITATHSAATKAEAAQTALRTCSISRASSLMMQMLVRAVWYLLALWRQQSFPAVYCQPIRTLLSVRRNSV